MTEVVLHKSPANLRASIDRGGVRSQKSGARAASAAEGRPCGPEGRLQKWSSDLPVL